MELMKMTKIIIEGLNKINSRSSVMPKDLTSTI